MNLLRRLFGREDDERTREAEALRASIEGRMETEMNEIRDLGDKLAAELACYVKKRAKE